MQRIYAVVAIILATGGAASAQSGYPVAGVNPDKRPEGAPAIAAFQPDKGYDARYYQGVAQPFPPHIPRADQGAWYTPFDRPGMPPPYDIRDWHKKKGKNP